MNTNQALHDGPAGAAGKKHEVKLDIDGTRDKLRQLDLMYAADALTEELSEAVKHNRPVHQVIDRLLGREVTADDVAQAFLAQALALKTTGDVTTVDGGNIAAALR